MQTLDTINRESFQRFRLRMGLNHGPVIAGVIGECRAYYADVTIITWTNFSNISNYLEILFPKVPKSRNMIFGRILVIKSKSFACLRVTSDLGGLTLWRHWLTPEANKKRITRNKFSLPLFAFHYSQRRIENGFVRGFESITGSKLFTTYYSRSHSPVLNKNPL